MKNFLIFPALLFGCLIFSEQSALAQCPTQANVVVKTHTNVTCFGANDGTITVDFDDASVGLPYNFELIDLSIPAIITPAVTETEDKTNRSVVYSNIPPGSYAVAFFKAGCTTLQITDSPFGFEITEPTEITVGSTIAPDCNAAVGVGNGKIDISISGGVAPYPLIVWTGPTFIPNGTTSTTANLEAGNYSVTITDDTGCSVTENFTVPVTTPADAGPSTGLTCGTNSFALSGNAFGPGEIGTWTGPPGVTFSPSDHAPNATANNLGVGDNVLTWTITDAAFTCTGSSDNITVTYSNVDLTGSADVVLPCFGATTATGTFTVTGGIAPFTYTLITNTAGATISLPSPGPTTSVAFSNGGAGVVTLRVQDNSGCTSQATINITQPVTPVTFSTMVNNPTCAFGSNGSIAVTPSGGVSPYSFSIDGGTSYPATGSTHTFSGLGAGTFDIRIRDANNCESVVQSVSISNPGGITFGTLVQYPSCFNGTNGSIQATLTGGGTGPYSFSIDGGMTYPVTHSSTNTFTGLSAGTYNLRVRDVNGCETVIMPVMIGQPTEVTFIHAVTDALCSGGNNGTIQISPSGGTGPYSFSIDGGTSYPVTQPGTHTFTGLVAGNYNIRVRDVGNCETAIVPVTVGEPAAIAFTPVVNNTTCFGGSDGSIQISPLGGVGPYSFSIDGGTSYPVTHPAMHTFTGLAAGNYDIRVRDANLCETAVMPALITQPVAITATPIIANVLCFGGSDGSIEITPSNGTAPYSFSIDGGASYPVTHPSTHIFTGLIAGNYMIRIRDVNNCESAVIPVTISQPPAVTAVTTPANATCFDGNNGSILVTPSGGVSPYDFSIDGGGSYPVAALTTHTFTGLIAGNYNIRVRDANGCETVVLVTAVGEATEITFTPTVVNVTCFNGTDGSISLTPAGGTAPYDFSIDGGASYPIIDLATHMFVGLTAQNYDLRVRDTNGCESVITTQAVGASSPVTIIITNATPTTCAGINDGVIEITSVTGGNGAYQYSIDNGTTFQVSSSFTGLAPGNYDVVVVDGNNCGSAPATITIGSGLVYDVSASSTPASCAGVNDGTITVTSTTGGVAPFQYILDGNVPQNLPVFTGVGVGNHSVVALDANGCLSNPFDIVVASSVVISSTNTVSPVTVCLGSDGSINVTGITGGSSPYDLSIDNGITFPITGVTSNNFTGLTAGDYNVVIRDNAGCLSTPALATVAAPPGCVLNCLAFNVITDAQTKRPTCNGGSDGVIALTISGPPGNYIVSLIPSSAPPVILPSGSTFVFSNLSENSYQYSITDGTNICIQSFTWDAVQHVQATAGSFQDSPCFGTPSGSAVLDATGSSTGQYFYSVDGIAWTEFIPGNVVTDLPGNGTYNIRVGGSVNDPCFDVVSVTINELGTAPLDTVYFSSVNGFPAVSYPESPIATRVVGIEESGAAPYEVRLELVDPYGITPNPPFIIDWTTVDETNPQSFIPQKQLDALYAGEYKLLLRDALGCQKTFSVVVGLDERIFIPNIFTPNKSDNLNSTFFVRNLPEKGSKLSITDRWGKEVYSSNDYNPDTLWDGGESPDGVYFYRLQIKGGKTYTGWVEILRGSKP